MRAMAVGFALTVLFAGLLASDRVVADSPSRVDILNAEDLAPLDGGNWVLASSMLGGAQTQGGIYVIDVRSGKAQAVYPNHEIVQSATTDCPAPVAAAAFAPHGIALFKSAKGETLLYVVNHGGRESVEMFAVEQQHDAPTLSWRGCIVVPAGGFGNAVAVVHDAIANDDIVYMTNMGKPLDGSAPVSPLGGNVLAWTAAKGWRDVPGSEIAAPNGLLVAGDGRVLYVASWTQGEVVRLTLKPAGVTRDVLKISLLPDNLRWSSDGSIFATGHHATVAAVTDCFMTKGRCEKTIPSAMTKIDAKTFAVRCAVDIDQSMATTTVNVGDELWIGTARGETVLRKPGSALTCN
ncbi:MAG: hypothetical protein ABW049_01390 [Spongiibacteraceae bacterium]